MRLSVRSRRFLLSLYLFVYYSLAIYFTWNWLIPSIFHLRSISLLESVGLVVLSRAVFNQQQVPTSWYTPPKKLR